jgi:hypothetical protein
MSRQHAIWILTANTTPAGERTLLSKIAVSDENAARHYAASASSPLNSTNCAIERAWARETISGGIAFLAEQLDSIC